jgi:hypothetical protein
VARLIAKDPGVEPVFEEVVTPARVVGSQAGKYDIGLGCTANTPARAYIPYQ